MERPLTLNINPREFVELAGDHLIYFNIKPKYLTTISPKFEGGSKTITISGAGLITIPNNCQVKAGGYHAGAMPAVQLTYLFKLTILASI